MKPKRIPFRKTTAEQRKLLYELWESTGSVSLACRKAHVGRGTFYYWKPRFDKYGYGGLEAYESRAPKEPRRTSPEIEQKVIAQREAHPEWGKQRLADELAKANNWVPLVSPNTVKRILKEAGLWETIKAEVKKNQAKPSSRSADEPGQTLNVDLCFVPAIHAIADKIPAVSGSSGRLKVQSTAAETEQRVWPGRVFENPELSYEEAMLEFVAASREQEKPPEVEWNEVEQSGQGSLKIQKRALKREEAQLRTERQRVREKRKLEDAAWRETRAARKVVQQNDQALSKAKRRQQRLAGRARDEAWHRITRDPRSTPM